MQVVKVHSIDSMVDQDVLLSMESQQVLETTTRTKNRGKKALFQVYILSLPRAIPELVLPPAVVPSGPQHIRFPRRAPAWSAIEQRRGPINHIRAVPLDRRL